MILGLAFKPATDDVRESPAIPIIKDLIRKGARIFAHDPIAIENMKNMLPNIDVNYYDSLENTVKDADAIVLVTSWPEYQLLHEIPGTKKVPLIDGRRFLDKDSFPYYKGIGISEK